MISLLEHRLLILACLIFACVGCARNAVPGGRLAEEPAAERVVVHAPPEGPLSVVETQAVTESTDHSTSSIPITDADARWGNPDALVTIVEYADFQCPFCLRVQPTLDEIKAAYGPERVRIIWKHNPLPFHKQALPAHEASQAVFALGGNTAFWKFHDAALAHQQALTEENFERWAVEAGVNLTRFRQERKNPKHAAKVQTDLAQNDKLGVNGTPNFFINGVKLSGAQPFPQFKAVIDAQLERAQELLTQGTQKHEVSLLLTERQFNDPTTTPRPKSEPVPEDTTVWHVPVLANDPVKGNRTALVTIVQWSDFECPFCARVEPTLQQILDTYGNDVRIVWKDNPLAFHPNAKPAANLARAAYAKGGNTLFWKAHERLFADQKTLGADLGGIGKDLGLRDAEIKAAIQDGKYNGKIAASIMLASDLEARGAPQFFINGRRLSGAQPFDRFEKLVQEQLEIAEALIKKGVPRGRIYDEIMKTAKKPPEPEKRQVAAPTAANPVRGPKNARIVIQAFSDFQCPFCKRVNPTLDQIVQQYGNQVKIVWRNMPLPFHKEAQLAAEAAHEVFVQQGADGFWKYHTTLFDNQKALHRQHLEAYAQAQGVDMPRFNQALDEHTHAKHVEADVAAAKQAGISGTPSFTINGYFLPGAQQLDRFEKLIKLALGKK